MARRCLRVLLIVCVALMAVLLCFPTSTSAVSTSRPTTTQQVQVVESRDPETKLPEHVVNLKDLKVKDIRPDVKTSFHHLLFLTSTLPNNYGCTGIYYGSSQHGESRSDGARSHRYHRTCLSAAAG